MNQSMRDLQRTNFELRQRIATETKEKLDAYDQLDAVKRLLAETTNELSTALNLLESVAQERNEFKFRLENMVIQFDSPSLELKSPETE